MAAATRTRRVLAWLACACIPLLASGACRQVVGIEERSEVCGGLTFADHDCAACMDTACCSEETACGSDHECEASANRSNGCGTGDAICRIDAANDAAPDNARLADFNACRTTNCALECNTCGGLVDEFGAECDTCVQTGCCDLAIDCAGDESCSKAFACINACTTITDCVYQCIHGPFRNAKVVALEKCLESTCYDECKIGQDWDCVDKPNWGPPPAGTSLALEFEVVDFLSKAVVPNAVVTPCRDFSNECSASATTDATGVAHVKLPVEPSFYWTGYFRITADGVEETLTGSTKSFARDDFTTAYTLRTVDLALLLASLGTTLDPTKALVFVTALDCKGMNAPNIRFELDEKDPGILPSYFAGPGTDGTHTNKIGTAAFGNVPVNKPYLGITSYLGDQVVGEDLAPIEPGVVTIWALFPKL